MREKINQERKKKNNNKKKKKKKETEKDFTSTKKITIFSIIHTLM